MKPSTALGDLMQIAEQWHTARQQERLWAAAAYEAIKRCADAGIPETKIAATANVDRHTVRRALGKLK